VLSWPNPCRRPSGDAPGRPERRYEGTHAEATRVCQGRSVQWMPACRARSGREWLAVTRRAGCKPVLTLTVDGKTGTLLANGSPGRRPLGRGVEQHGRAAERDELSETRAHAERLGVFHSQVSVPLQQQGAPVGGDASRRGATTGALPGDVAAGATIHRVPPITSADSGCRSLPAHIETRQPVTALPAHRRSCGTARTQPASAAARVRSSASKSCLPSVSMPQLSGGLSGSRSMMPSTTNRRVQPSGQPVDEGVQSGGALGISQP
jgi:hypothetical protein